MTSCCRSLAAALSLLILPGLAAGAEITGSRVLGGVVVDTGLGLGLAAGSMLFVVSHEVIPETHRSGYQAPASSGLMAGFAIMMLLDTTLG